MPDDLSSSWLSMPLAQAVYCSAGCGILIDYYRLRHLARKTLILRLSPRYLQVLISEAGTMNITRTMSSTGRFLQNFRRRYRGQYLSLPIAASLHGYWPKSYPYAATAFDDCKACFVLPDTISAFLHFIAIMIFWRSSFLDKPSLHLSFVMLRW